MQTYMTQEGDVLDALCYAHYGEEHRTTEAVLALNPTLANFPAVLPVGVVILFPDLQPSSPVQTQVQLWD